MPGFYLVGCLLPHFSKQQVPAGGLRIRSYKSDPRIICSFMVALPNCRAVVVLDVFWKTNLNGPYASRPDWKRRISCLCDSSITETPSGSDLLSLSPELQTRARRRGAARYESEGHIFDMRIYHLATALASARETFILP